MHSASNTGNLNGRSSEPSNMLDTQNPVSLSHGLVFEAQIIVIIFRIPFGPTPLRCQALRSPRTALIHIALIAYPANSLSPALGLSIFQQALSSCGLVFFTPIGQDNWLKIGQSGHEVGE